MWYNQFSGAFWNENTELLHHRRDLFWLFTIVFITQIIHHQKMFAYFGLRFMGGGYAQFFSFFQRGNRRSLFFFADAWCLSAQLFTDIIIFDFIPLFITLIPFLDCLVWFQNKTFILRAEKNSQDENARALLLFLLLYTSLPDGSSIMNTKLDHYYPQGE